MSHAAERTREPDLGTSSPARTPVRDAPASARARRAVAALLALALALLTDAPRAQHPSDPEGSYDAAVAEASDDWKAALEAITTAEGIAVELFAAEPHLANPVCLWVDGQGAVYVGETFRHHAGVTDIREHWDWLDADLEARTVADRVAYMAEFEGEDFPDYSVHHDRVRLIRDTDGDGLADRATVFADGFDDPAAGIGAGLLEHGGQVYYACIPDLWRLADTDGDDVADERQVLHTGYGVHTGLLGHDLHGLRIGPDGRLYFTVGDRAAYVETEAGVIDHTHTGCVFRCELDGSGLEVFHTGLRNPQELVFDAYGNLWTGDNNSDGGDEARWVHLLPGGDSGWRFSYQWIDHPVSRGPWNDEKLWHPRHPTQAAYLLPPVDNIANGPSGLAVYPGTGLSARYADHFFLCDFVGGQKWSGVWSFAVEPEGAGFTLVDKHEFLWDTLVTDCDFGPDGALWFSDWVAGWNQTGKGRVFRAVDPVAAAAPIVAETAALLAAGTADLSLDALAGQLGHVDMRVRQAAQLELVSRGDDGLARLRSAALDGRGLFERLHGIWGLGIAGRRDARWLEPLIGLAGAPHPEVRAQALNVLGDARHAAASEAVLAGLGDPEPRVQLYAALAAGRLSLAEAFPQLCALAVGAGRDVTLRHGAVMGLQGVSDDAGVLSQWVTAPPSLRTAIVLVLRRLGSPLLSTALTALVAEPGAQGAPWLALEIARAIHDDEPVTSAYPTLAALLAEPDGPGLLSRFLDTEQGLPTAAFVRRLVAANLHLGHEHHARRVADLALRDDADDGLRVEALQRLAEWGQPGSRDMVMGDWRPFERRDASFLPRIVQRLVDGRIEAAPVAVRVAFAELVAACEASAQDGLLADWARDATGDTDVRIAALDALVALDAGALPDVVDVALADADGRLRAAGLDALQTLDSAQLWRRLPAIVADGELTERRVAYRLLGEVDDLPPGADVDALLTAELARLDAGLLSSELALDLVTAARARGVDAPRHVAASEQEQLLAPWLDSLHGGDVAAGREVFLRTDLACQRCHSTDADSGLRVGPDLEGVGDRLSRLQILASIVDPNRRAAPGYDTTNLFLTDGRVHAGRVLSEDADGLSLIDADGEVHAISHADIDTRRPGLSAMPEGLAGFLTPHDLRDLVEYLARL